MRRQINEEDNEVAIKTAVLAFALGIVFVYILATLIGFLCQVDTGYSSGGLSLVEYIQTQIEWFKLIKIY